MPTTGLTDELNDALDYIGVPDPRKPSSIRRSELLSLCKKLQEKSFLRQFRDYNGEARLLRDLGNERDIIAGFAIFCILATLLQGPGLPIPILQQLKAQGISHLLELLLANDMDIEHIARDRKSNVARQTQKSISALKKDMQELPIWDAEEAVPGPMSPRTMGLQVGELVVKQTWATGDEEDYLISAPVVGHLFRIVEAAADSQEAVCWNYPEEPEARDLRLALSLLEPYSIRASRSAAGTGWSRPYLPVTARLLKTTLRRGMDRFGVLESLACKLTLNTANNNPAAQQYFVGQGLLRLLAEAAYGPLGEVMKSTGGEATASDTSDTRSDKIPEPLVIVLGVMINISDDDPSASVRALETEQVSWLNRLMKLFLDSRSRSAEVCEAVYARASGIELTRFLPPLQIESVEEAKINVTFAYLAILLGHLCLYSPVRERFESLHAGGNLDPLLGSIKEFLAIYQTAELATSLPAKTPGRNRFSERLQSLVDRLESL